VRAAAFAAFGVAAAAGLVLAATTAWWLVAVGAVSVAAAWFYTGGSKPYGYLGLGEVMVFVFFGLVAVLGTEYVQAETVSLAGGYAAIGIGCLACAILVANNLRDIPTDREAGKNTLAVRLGEARTRRLYEYLVVTPLVLIVGLVGATSAWVLLAAAAVVPAMVATGIVRKASGRDLVPALQLTGLAELAYGAGLFVGLLVAGA
jgi:1,4-dihydroxy-2-naphthoate octaprenyltransferase